MAFEKDLVVREHNRPLMVALALLTMATVPLLFVAVGSLAPIFSAAFPGAGSLCFGTWYTNFGGRNRRRHLVASDEGVSIDGKLVVPSSEIQNARFIPHAKAPFVRLGGAHGRALLIAMVTDQEEGLRLIAAVGHDAGKRKERFRIMPRKPRLFVGALPGILFSLAFAFVVLKFRISAQMLSALVVVIGAPLVVLFTVLRGPTAEIGIDGVLISEGKVKEWIPFADVRAIEAHEGSVRFVLVDKHVDLRVAEHRHNIFAKTLENARDAFLIRAREALAAHRASVGPRELAATLMRADRDKDEWLTALRKMRDGETDYRSSPARDEELWRVVEDPGAPEDARAAAAFILRRPGEHDAARLRVAAQAVAAPRLRIALESDDEAALEAYCCEPIAKRASA